jgi:sulfonate transport system substrate-binding protein
LEHAGIALKDIDVVFLKPVDARAALDHGSIDAWATWEPYTSILELSENARILTDGRALPPQHDYVVARTDSLGGGKRAALDYLHRLYRAQNWALQHPDVFAQVWDNLTGVPPDLAKRWFRRAQPHNVPIDSKLIAGEQNVIDLYARAGVIQHRFQVADAFDRLLNK